MTICYCPILFAFYNVGRVSYNWTGVRTVELNTVVVLQRTARTCSLKRAARAARLFFLTRPIKFFICGVVVAVAVVDAKAP